LKYGVKVALIDTEDLPRLLELNVDWKARKDMQRENNFYVHCKNEGKTIQLHRFILDAPRGKVVDHIFHNPLDNRKSKLRICTNAENCQNKNGVSSHNTSGYRNVCKLKNGKFFVSLIVNKKTHNIGVFSDVLEANEAAIKARKELMPFSIK
jgi:hypothetical protein